MEKKEQFCEWIREQYGNILCIAKERNTLKMIFTVYLNFYNIARSR